MAPRGHALPNAATESAREARKTFFCELCQKGYARMNDFEAHEGSYDHTHRKRLKEMKNMIRDPHAAAKAKAAEQRASEQSGIQTISVSSLKPSNSASGTKKKPVFKSTLQPQNAALVAAPPSSTTPSSLGGDSDRLDPATANEENDHSGAVRNGWFEDQYDPMVITGCDDDCTVCQGHAEAILL